MVSENIPSTKIILYIAGAVFVAGVLYTMYKLFGGGLSSFLEGIGDVLGVGAQTVNALTSGCTKQVDCTTIYDSSTCGNNSGCYWSPAQGTGDVAKCIILSGRAPGSGGLTDLGECGLGLAFIGWMSSLLIAPIILAVASRFSKNKNVEVTAKLSGEGISDVLREVVRDTKDRGASTIKELERVNEISESNRRIVENNVGKFAANVSSTIVANKAITDSDIPSAQKVERANEVLANQVSVERVIKEDLDRMTEISSSDTKEERDRKEREKESVERAKKQVERSLLKIDYNLLREAGYKPSPEISAIIKQQLNYELEVNRLGVNHQNVLYFFDQ